MRSTLHRLFAVIMLFSPVAFAAEEPAQLAIDYDKAADTLSLDVEKASLKTLLATIAMQSQIEVLFDERADREVTMQLEKRSLETGLENLLRESSYLFRYGEDEAGAPGSAVRSGSRSPAGSRGFLQKDQRRNPRQDQLIPRERNPSCGNGCFRG